MNKENLFITFPVDAGMTTWERNYKKIFIRDLQILKVFLLEIEKI